VRCLAAASSALRPVLAGPARPAEFLGVARGALYLRTSAPPGALAALSHDAVRLPCSLLLPTTSAELPLTSLAPASLASSAGFVAGDGAVRWTGPDGPVVVRAVREWAPARPAPGEVTAGALAAVRAALSRHAPRLGAGQVLGCEFPVAIATGNSHPWPEDRLRADLAMLAGLAGATGGYGAGAGAAEAAMLAGLAGAAGDPDASVAAAARLLGRGPGLTPSGDDILAGFLAGAAAFGLDAAALRHAVAVLAPARTTALSAALLRHAARGECLDELAAVAAVLTSQPPCRSELAGTGRAVGRLLSVGHTSGAALALGLVLAAESALHRQAGRAA
jgi:hypothetical protein